MDRRGTAIVLGGTANHGFAMGTFLVDLKRTSPDLADEVVIFHDDELSAQDRNTMEKIYPVRFIPYDFPIHDRSILKNESISYFSPMVFCKYECLRLLDEYRTVVWSDYDVILLDSIKDITDPEHGHLRMILGEHVGHSCHSSIPDYDMSGAGVSAALMVFRHDHLNYQDMYTFCREKTVQYLSHLHLPEQAILGIMLQEFNLHPDALDYHTYACHPSLHSQHPEAKILHAHGPKKFWNGLHNERWEENYAHWLKLGGSKKETAAAALWRKVKRKIKTKTAQLI